MKLTNQDSNNNMVALLLIVRVYKKVGIIININIIIMKSSVDCRHAHRCGLRPCNYC
jgi:hypothetical protein